MTEATTPIPNDPPDNQDGATTSTADEQEDEPKVRKAPRPSRDYSIPADPPDNQGGGW